MQDEAGVWTQEVGVGGSREKIGHREGQMEQTGNILRTMGAEALTIRDGNGKYRKRENKNKPCGLRDIDVNSAFNM